MVIILLGSIFNTKYETQKNIYSFQLESSECPVFSGVVGVTESLILPTDKVKVTEGQGQGQPDLQVQDDTVSLGLCYYNPSSQPGRHT